MYKNNRTCVRKLPDRSYIQKKTKQYMNNPYASQVGEILPFTSAFLTTVITDLIHQGYKLIVEIELGENQVHPDSLSKKYFVTHVKKHDVYVVTYKHAKEEDSFVAAKSVKNLRLYLKTINHQYKTTVKIRYLYKSQHGIDSITVKIPKSQIDQTIPELYPDIDINLLTQEFIQSKEKILILSGVPGVGKTHFIKHFVESKLYIYIKNAGELDQSELWANILAENDPAAIIFDDLDIDLQSRDKNGFVNNLLSYSDGLLQNNTKIIITTNIPIQTIDQALVRPGRCFDFLQLQPLTYSQALYIWTDILNMSEKQFKLFYKENEIITQASLLVNLQKTKEQNTKRTYIKDANKQFYTIEQKLKDLKISINNSNEAKVGFNVRTHDVI